METEWEGHVAGIFEGYRGGRVYELSDGRRWRQESNTSEYVYRERPKARLIRERGSGHPGRPIALAATMGRLGLRVVTCGR